MSDTTIISNLSEKESVAKTDFLLIEDNNSTQKISVENLLKGLVDEEYIDDRISQIELLEGPKGDKGDTGEQGPKGDKGDQGYTPVKGVDYFTASDMAELATKSELNEVKQSVSDGKTLIASAITDKGIVTSNTDTFAVMAANIRLIQSGGGSGESSDTTELENQIAELQAQIVELQTANETLTARNAELEAMADLIDEIETQLYEARHDLSVLKDSY